MNVVAEKVELQSLLTNQYASYNVKIINSDMKNILSTAIDLLNISKDHANSKRKSHCLVNTKRWDFLFLWTFADIYLSAFF